MNRRMRNRTYGGVRGRRGQPRPLLNRPSIFRRQDRGFTIIELIVVIVMIGILAITILPKWNGNSGFDERGFRDRVVAALRYAQKSAIASRRSVCASFSSPPASVSFRFSTANGAANCAIGDDLTGLDGNRLEVTASGNVTFESPPADVIFYASGAPASPIPAEITISGLPPALKITVEAETGYVH